MTNQPIRILLPPVWSGVYLNIARLMQYQFEDVGIGASINEVGEDVAPTQLNIVLGWHLLPSDTIIPSPYVLYQLEPFTIPYWQKKLFQHITLFRQAVSIWDYSPLNMPYLEQLNLPYLIKPLGFHPRLIEVQHAPYPDFDVLFVGFVTERRKTILEKLMRYCSVSVQPKWGKDYLESLGKSKLLLNIHQHDLPTPLEQARVAYALNNQACVLSEHSADNPYPELPMLDYDALIDQVMYYLHHQKERHALTQALHADFKTHPYHFGMDEHVKTLVTHDQQKLFLQR